MLVEDNDDSASTLAAVLSEVGHTVVVANDGRAALDLARDFQPEVALLDIGLPALGGYELARHLRTLPNMRDDLRFIAVTGYGQESERRRSFEAGFAAHLVKPVALDELLDAIR